MMFHSFKADISVIEVPVSFNNPFYYRPHELCVLAANEVRGMLVGNSGWRDDAAKGKMMGVLIVRDTNGKVGFLAGFSGLLCGSNKQEGFVPPVFDFLAPDGYFKKEEAAISDINKMVDEIKTSDAYLIACKQLEQATAVADETVNARRRLYAANKAARAEQRASGLLPPEETAELVRNSQFEKAELRRLIKSHNKYIDEAKYHVAYFADKMAALLSERKLRSAALQEWLFANFKVLNANGEEKSVLDIFRERTGGLPPAGTGECAAPKMLQYAYLHGLTPLAMAEFWVGASPAGEVRKDGCFYASCMSKCHSLLSFMLQGLPLEDSALENGGASPDDIKIVYEDEYILVADKPHGMLSVPGIVGGTSLQDWLRDRCKRNDIYMAHRLDMATSGLLVAAKSVDILKSLQAQFASKSVEKRYIALLDGVPRDVEGQISLPLAADYCNRPRQMVDFASGKPSLTFYKVLRLVQRGGKECAVVELIPVTGRTHQLRVHCAHQSGLDVAIVGDALYGIPAERLMLHAGYLSFMHPVSGEKLIFESPFDADAFLG